MQPLDVLITSTCRKTIEPTLKGFLAKVSCPRGFRFVVNIDVLDPGYLERELAFLKGMGITEIMVNREVVSPGVNHARAVTRLFNSVRSPFFFFLEDDWLFLRRVDLDPLVNLMERYPFIDHIRFSKEKIKKRAWLYYVSQEISEDVLRDNTQADLDGIPLVKSWGWTFNPGLNRSALLKDFGGNGIVEASAEVWVSRRYQEVYKNRGVYIYGHIGEPAAVKDLGRDRLLQWSRKAKHIISGKKYAEYKF